MFAGGSRLDFGGRRILVVGDLMLDEFVHGEVTRISPEAPVPILEVKYRSMMPGGAANAAANIASLGGSVVLVGCVGDDAPAVSMRSLLEKSRIDAHLVVDATRPTTLKTRIVARNQQVVRIDHEARGPYPSTIGEALARSAVEAMPRVDAVIVSDYGKGVVTPELVAAVVAAAGTMPVVVDPKRRDFSVYRGVTVLTPNLPELNVATGTANSTNDEVVAAARGLLPSLDGGAILVTRGADGMTLVSPKEPVIHTPARARAVFDVTGAGDTVVGALVLALANGLTMREAIDIASAAAAIAVSKPGTATVTLAELSDELDRQTT